MAKYYRAKKTKFSLSTGLLIAGLALSSATQAKLLYSITDLGERDTGYQDINASGQMTGWTITAGNTRHAFVTNSSGEKIDLGTLGGGESIGMAINNTGQVTGMHGDFRRAFVTSSSGEMADVGDLGGNSSRITRAFGINANGLVTGNSSSGDDIIIDPDLNTCNPRAGGCQPFTLPPPQHAFVTTSSGALIDLGTLGGRESYGVAINDAGRVAGNSEKSTTDSTSHAFITGNNLDLIDLGTLGGNRSEAHAINASGQVTGWAETAEGSVHAFITNSSGQMIDLLTLGDGSGINTVTLSNGIDVNAAGQVVGEYFDSAGHSRAFVTENGNIMDLNTLLYGDIAGWDLQTVYAINDAGQILGSGAKFFGGRNFLLTPISSVPLPAAIWLFGSGIIGLLGFKRIKPYPLRSC
ncbi:integral membrane protein containing repeats-like protein [Methyloglobulus morosus KoM1]|uniref:Integral membrane protein containing repeats-like protein n=1 Tax=Methyloglobulus morosus KoM1 TaxID=1116472 RepID=V5C0R4_9GAMM|nr:HAF repeat-containing protein [Methyloglobulus morosus]ESS73679.1 integral membrane protein containing repeats-like protein [Methyloglobulus morosus KoM1]